MSDSFDRLIGIIDGLKNFDFFYEFSNSHEVFQYGEKQMYMMQNEFGVLYKRLTDEEKCSIKEHIMVFLGKVASEVDMEVERHIREKLEKITLLNLSN